MGLRKNLVRALYPRAKLLASNRAHWAQATSYQPSWANRAAVAATLIGDDLVVCDIGCGAVQDLGRALQSKCTYLPCDMHAWSDEVEYCDLNLGVYPERALARADVVTLLGVVEYIVDPPRMFVELGRRGKPVVFTYNPIDFGRSRQRLWVNKLSVFDVVQLTQAAGLTNLLMVPFTATQFVFRASPGNGG